MYTYTEVFAWICYFAYRRYTFTFGPQFSVKDYYRLAWTVASHEKEIGKWVTYLQAFRDVSKYFITLLSLWSKWVPNNIRCGRFWSNGQQPAKSLQPTELSSDDLHLQEFFAPYLTVQNPTCRTGSCHYSRTYTYIHTYTIRVFKHFSF